MSRLKSKRKKDKAALEKAETEGTFLFFDRKVVLEENESIAKDNIRWEKKYANLYGEMEAKLIEVKS